MPHAFRPTLKVLALAAALALGACSGKSSSPTTPQTPTATCTDGAKNGAETGVDCGGATCVAAGKTCANGQGCGIAADCASGYCNGSNVCADASCTDGVKNGAETGTDCGGAACLALVTPKRCPVGQGCGVAADCSSGFCNPTTHLCATPTCADGFKNGAETDRDCGGAACDGEGKTCGLGLSCLDPTDCTSTVSAPATCDPNSHVCVAQCTGNGVTCPTGGGACCSGYCNGSNQCADPCKSNGASCGADAECCTSVCSVATPRTCQQPATCTANGLACPTGGGVCCSGTCNASNVCADPCTGNGKSCGFDSDCCTGYCDPSKVCATRPTCKAEGYSCTSDANCCTGGGTPLYCSPVTQLCAPAVSTCEASGSSCASGNECCSTACSTITSTCTPTTFCKTPGAACADSGECCSLSCVSGQCANTVCKASGQTCASAGECCTGSCNVTCQALPAPSGTSACKTLGDACALGADCCSTNCQGGKCTPAYLCHAPSDLCYRPEDCCSGMCTAPSPQTSPATPGRCVAPSGGCNQDGAPCAGASNCCTRLCKDLGSGVSVCQPASGCRMTGDFCDRTESCCGGSQDASSTTGYGVFCDSKGTSPGPTQYDTSTKDDRTCSNGQSCNPPGNICGGSGAVPASQNCCDGKKEVCKQDANGIYRCFGGGHCSGTGYDANDPACCIPANSGTTPGGVCQFRDQCCNFAPCIPDDQGVLRCTVSACKPLDAACGGADDSSCCAGTVCTYDGVGAFACKVPASCTPNGGSCTFSNQCCSSNCNEGTCLAPCVGVSGTCTADGDCCNGLGCSIPGGATSGTCTSASTCAPTGGNCTVSADCCNASASPAEQCLAGKCAVPPSCTPQLQPCNAPTSSGQCCNGLSCVGPEGAECTAGGLGCVCDSCAVSGATCGATACCLGLVCDGTCQTCATVGGSCTSQSGCCSGLTCADTGNGQACSGGTCTCDVCLLQGQSCSFGGESCCGSGVGCLLPDGSTDCGPDDASCTCQIVPG